MRVSATGVLVVLLAAGAAEAVTVMPPGAPDGVDLVCKGGAGGPGAWHWDKLTNRYVPSPDDGVGRADSHGAIVVHLESAAGEIRVPKALQPDETHDEDGWWVLEKLEQGLTEVRAQFRLNALRQPQIRIRRADGHFVLTDDGLTLEGRCVRVTGRTEAGL